MSLTQTNYTFLEELLSEKKWLEADRETNEQMLIAADRKRWGGWLQLKDLENFSCQDLKVIDRLWLQYSQGKWGFSLQKQIYQEVGKNYYDLGKLIGWRQEEKWLKIQELLFDNDTPNPLFPFSFRGLSSRIGEVNLASSAWIEAFFIRFDNCQVKRLSINNEYTKKITKNGEIF